MRRLVWLACLASSAFWAAAGLVVLADGQAGPALKAAILSCYLGFCAHLQRPR